MLNDRKDNNLEIVLLFAKFAFRKLDISESQYWWCQSNTSIKYYDVFMFVVIGFIQIPFVGPCR